VISLRRFVQAFAVAAPLVIAGAIARADLPVIDFTAIGKWVQQLQQMAQQVQLMTQQVQQAIQTVTALTNIPQNLVSQVTGLLQSSIQNPLQGINLNLQTLMTGSGVGTCTGGSNYLSLNQAWTAGGNDFLGATINGSASRLAGLMACTSQMLGATQQRLQQMPQLLSELQNCKDVTCAAAISGRIQLENATINAQQQQAVLMGLYQQQQRWTADDLIAQKMRADAEGVFNGLPSTGVGSNPFMATGSTLGAGSVGPGGISVSAPVFNSSCTGYCP
jgi:hypothetical protein